MDLGKHAIFIWASYGVTLVTLGAIIAWLVLDGARLKRRLDDLEAGGGVRRRRD